MQTTTRGNPDCRIVAEIGLSHEGSIGFCESFISSAKRAGADIIKFQMHNADQESSSLENFRVQFSNQDKTRWGYWERTSFKIDDWLLIFEKVKNVGAIAQVTVFDVQGLHFCLEAGITEIKLGSGDLNNEELLEEINKAKKYRKDLNLTISTGMATYSEIQHSLNKLEALIQAQSLIVMQCTSMYPTPLDKVGIDSMLEIKKRFDVQIGLSDHSSGINAAIVGIMCGAARIEKHVVFDHRMFGPDVSSSIDFDELEVLCKFRQDFAKIMTPTDKEGINKKLLNQKLIFGRSLGLKQNAKKGHVLKLEDFCLRKPGGGYSWQDRYIFVGKMLKKDYFTKELLTELHVENP